GARRAARGGARGFGATARNRGERRQRRRAQRGRPRFRERPRLAVTPLASAFERAALVRTHDLVLEALQEELSAAARAERLVALRPDRGLTASDGAVGDPKLLDRRTPSGRRD